MNVKAIPFSPKIPRYMKGSYVLLKTKSFHIAGILFIIPFRQKKN